ncbi:hypothetical protein [Clostridium disporicum]|uniref:hypothetical protein n=1 Tax=Clostridium disporicum TaxID=84024 RepID=UPI0034A42F4C
MAKMLNKQILKLDGKDTFFEIMANAFGIDKVQINFRKYDDSQEKGSKITQSVDIFIDIPEALVLSQDILSGKIAQLAKTEKAKGAKYPAQIWQTMGGVNAEKAKTRGLRTDGMALSRVLKIVPGLKQPFVFTAESGKGEENDKGLIVPRYGTTPENRIMVAVTDEQLKQIALLIQTHVQAYYCAQYTTGAYMIEYTPKK